MKDILRRNGLFSAGFGARSAYIDPGFISPEESLKRKQYYGHPRNQFWRIMGDLFGAGPDLNYAERTEILIRNGVSLWDTVKTCSRTTSADARIRNAAYNDIDSFLLTYPGIKAIFFDGRTAASLFERGRRGKPDIHAARITLPSTSPAHAAMKYEEKLGRWKIIKNYLELKVRSEEFVRTET